MVDGGRARPARYVSGYLIITTLQYRRNSSDAKVEKHDGDKSVVQITTCP